MVYSLSAATRTMKGEKARTAKEVPAVVYGAGSEAQSLTLNKAEFLKLFKQAGGSSLVDLAIDGKDAGKVLVQEVQNDPVKDNVIHVDLRRIDMNKAMTAPVTLKFVGEAPVIKASGGTLVTTVNTVEVKCLPKDLVAHIEVDLSGLNTFEDIIKVKDLKLPAGIQIVNPHAEDLVAKVARALTEEEIKAMEEAAKAPSDLSKIEVAGKKKEEEGEAAEGEEGAKAEEKKPEEKKEEKKK